MPRIVELISTIKATTDLRIAKGKWLRLQEALLQRGVTTAIIACTDLNAVTDAAAGIIERIDSAEALAAATVREYCRRTENRSKPL
jgi:aspartate/glutamate racemase